jgi:hypothetical protein
MGNRAADLTRADQRNTTTRHGNPLQLVACSWRLKASR